MSVNVDDQVVTGLKSAPITLERPLAHDLDFALRNPGLARANEAADGEHPRGSPDADKSLTVLQQHCAYWDRDNDGLVYPWDTFVGFRDLGFNLLVCFLAVVALHSGAPYLTQDSWIPDPLMPWHLKNAHRIKHGSDTETYDKEGRFSPQHFEEIFTKYDRGSKGGLSLMDIVRMLKGNALIMDPVGWTAAAAEWGFSWVLGRNDDGLLTKENTRRIYDGTLFHHIADEVRRKREARGSHSTAKDMYKEN